MLTELGLLDWYAEKERKERELKKKEKEITQEEKNKAIDKAISMLFPNVNLTPKQHNTISRYIIDTHKGIGCCVLRKSQRGTSDADKMCEKLNLDMEQREVIITQGWNVQYSANQTQRPT